MKVICKTVVFSILVLGLYSCAVLAPTPTATPAPSATSLPSQTPTLEPTSTVVPTDTPTLTPIPPTETPEAPVIPMPTGKPVAEWEGIPVMPDAIAGDGDGQGYSYAIRATPADIVAYYQDAMEKLGWKLFATGQGSTESTILIFIKGSETISVSILPQFDDLNYVLLVK